MADDVVMESRQNHGAGSGKTLVYLAAGVFATASCCRRYRCWARRLRWRAGRGDATVAQRPRPQRALSRCAATACACVVKSMPSMASASDLFPGYEDVWASSVKAATR